MIDSALKEDGKEKKVEQRRGDVEICWFLVFDIRLLPVDLIKAAEPFLLVPN